jgi:hypothetical protein
MNQEVLRDLECVGSSAAFSFCACAKVIRGHCKFASLESITYKLQSLEVLSFDILASLPGV